jgi:peptidoglycan/xylan/chitin deacetylase (PgdA/CDA1 family)
VAASVSVTFDNLGEASEMEAGTWPDDAPTGQHFSVVEKLPLVLDLLDRHGVTATFFVEGLNAEMYPDAVREIAARGHEIGLHAWRHEQWGQLEPQRERELLERGTEAMRGLGLEVVGFRPPGGKLTDQSIELLRELDYLYVSPEGERAGVVDGLAVLPFRWELVDAYLYGNGKSPDELVKALDEHGDGHLTMILHPFLASEGVLADVLERAREMRCVRMDQCAGSLL